MKTIFVLDDDLEQSELLAQALAAPERRVRAFSDPIRALAALTTEEADLLIVDLSMPWIDGTDVVEAAHLRRPELQVFLISGYPRGAEIATAKGLCFFPKPIDLAELRAAVVAALSGTRGVEVPPPG